MVMDDWLILKDVDVRFGEVGYEYMARNAKVSPPHFRLRQALPTSSEALNAIFGPRTPNASWQMKTQNQQHTIFLNLLFQLLIL